MPFYLPLWGQSFGFSPSCLFYPFFPLYHPSSYPLFYSSSVALPLYNPSFFHPSSYNPSSVRPFFLPYSISSFLLFHFTLSLYSLYSLPSYPSQSFLFPYFLLITFSLYALPFSTLSRSPFLFTALPLSVLPLSTLPPYTLPL